MARGVITLRPVPAGIPAHIAENGYADVAVAECRRYIALLQRTIGPEPAGARLRVRGR